MVSQIKVGERGQAYVIDAQGRLIAHPDISLVLRNTDMTKLPQVQAARAAGSRRRRAGAGSEGHARAAKCSPPMRRSRRWAGSMFVELPVEEAYAPLYRCDPALGLLLLRGV